MNGKLLWGQRSDEQYFQRNWADETQWTVPFVLSPEATVALAALSPAEAQNRLSSWVHGALIKRNSYGPIRGSSYGAISWGVADVNYVHGMPGGQVVVYSSIGIGD